MSFLRNPWNWAKAVLLVLLAAFWIPVFQSGQSVSSTAAFDCVKQILAESLDAETYPEQDATKIRRLLGIDPSLATNIWFARQDDLMSAREIVLLEFTPENREALEAAMEARQSAQMNVFEGYAPEQYDQVKNGLIDFQNNYGLYVVGDDPRQVDALFLQAIKGEKGCS